MEGWTFPLVSSPCAGVSVLRTQWAYAWKVTVIVGCTVAETVDLVADVVWLRSGRSERACRGLKQTRRGLMADGRSWQVTRPRSGV